jgi:hypothetical protein
VQQRGLSDASLSGDNASCSSAAHRRDEGIQQLTCRLTPDEKVISDIAGKVSKRNLSHPAITNPQHRGDLLQHVPLGPDAPGFTAIESGFT